MNVQRVCGGAHVGAHVGARMYRPKANIKYLPVWRPTLFINAGLSLEPRAHQASKYSWAACSRDPVSTSPMLDDRWAAMCTQLFRGFHGPECWSLGLQSKLLTGGAIFPDHLHANELGF